MPRGLAVDVDLFSRGGQAILDRIEGQGFDVLSRRPEVGKLAKLGLLLRTLIRLPTSRTSPSPLMERVS
jgi:phytoene/squalene synthetase